MKEYTIIQDINTIFTSFINNLNLVYYQLSNYYDTLTDDDKCIYSDCILTTLILNIKKISSHNVNWFYTFCTPSFITNCSDGTIQRILTEVFNIHTVYIHIIQACMLSQKYFIINEHLEEFYTHPKYTTITGFQLIHKMLNIDMIERLLKKACVRNCDCIIYFIIHNYNKKLSNTIKSKLLPYYSNYIYYINQLDQYTTLCKDEYTIVLNYLFG